MVESIRKSAYGCTKYIPGKSTSQVCQDYNLSSVIKLGSNENSYAPFPVIKQAMLDEIDRIGIYPEKKYVVLKQIIGENAGLTEHHVGLGHGAGNVLDVVAKTFIEDGDEVIIPEKTYSLYTDISKIMGAKIVKTAMTSDYKIDLTAVKNAITDRTKLIYICNPNNPTSTIVDKNEFTVFVQNLPKHVWVLLDEAYIEFTDADLVPDAISLIKQGYNLIQVRTFSKYYGLAGGRVGYMLADTSVADMYNTVSEPFNCNRIGLAGAVAILNDDTNQADFYAKKMMADREIMAKKLESFGFEVTKSHTNFLFLKTKYQGADIAEKLLHKGVIVRPCGGWSYPNHVRVSIGNTQENLEFLAKIEEVLNDM